MKHFNKNIGIALRVLSKWDFKDFQEGENQKIALAPVVGVKAVLDKEV